MRANRIASIMYSGLLLLAALPANAQVVGQSACTNSTETVLVSNLTNYFGAEGAGLALGNGYLYVVENVNFAGTPPYPSAFILQVSMDGSTQTQLSNPGFGNLTAVALDASGNLYAADGNGAPNTFFTQPVANNLVWKWDGSSWSKYITGITNPTGLAFDASGNLYVASFGDGQTTFGSVFKYDTSGNLLSTVWTAPDSTASPYGLAVDQSGNLYIAGFGVTANGSSIYKVLASTGAYSVFANPGLIEPTSLAFDAPGNLYASYYNSLKILRFAPDGSYVEFPGGGTSDDASNAIVVDAQGDVFTVVNGGRTTPNPALVKLTGLTSSNSGALNFSSSMNPNAAWMYSYSSASASSLLQTSSTGGLQFPSGQAASPGLDFWTAGLDSPAFDPDVFANVTNAILSTGCCDPLSPGALGLQPSVVTSGPYNSVVQWNAPGDGNYFIAGQFSGADFAGPTMTTASVVTPTGPILGTTLVNGFGASSVVPFSSALSVIGSAQSCTNVLFTVAPGSNNLSTQLDVVAIPNNNNNNFFSPQPSLWFGSQSVGSASTAQTVTFTDATTVSSVTIVGQNAADFVLQSDQCTGATVTSSCPVSVAFQPTVLGARSALLQVTSSDTNYPVSSIPIAGVGTTNTLLSLTSSSASPSYGASLTFTATVTPSGSTTLVPAGAVQFYDGTNVLGTPVTLTGSQAQYQTSSLSTGAHNIEAAFIPSGGGSVGVSAGTLAVSINKATPIIVWPPATITYGTTVMAALNATTTTSVSGSFTYSLNGAPLSGNEIENAGSYTLNAVFTPTDTTDYNTATASTSLQVNPAAPSVTFTGAPTSAAYQSTFTVTATTNASSVPSITGTGACTVGAVSGMAASATATVTMTSGTGTCSLTASWGADSNYSATTATQSTTASKSAPAVTFTGAPTSAAYQSTFTVTATTNASSVPSITGTGTCTVGAVSGMAASATATVTMTSGTGTCSLTASWGADSNYSATTAMQSTAAAKASSAITLASNLNPSTSGQTVTFIATLPSQTTGTVSFMDGTTLLATATVSGGVASISTSTLTVGTHSISASYSGDTNFAAATSAVLSQVVNSSGTKATTSTGLVSSMNPQLVNQPITFTATVSAPDAVSGSVTFRNGRTNLGTVNLVGNLASFTTSFATTGSRSITAQYSGDANNLASTSPTLNQSVVNQLPTSTTVSSSLNPSYLGQSVTFTAIVSPSSGTIPNGETVTFTDGGGATIGQGTLSGGSASLTLSTLPAGTHPIRATYGGDTTYAGSTSPKLNQTVNKYPTTTALTVSAMSLSYGQPETLSAIVTSSGPAPTGTVTFKNGTSNLGTASLVAGTATLKRSNLAVGTYSITATYNGDANSTTSSSAAASVTVTQATTATNLTSSPNPSTLGQIVTFTATVTSNATPTGSVKFTAGPTVLGTVNLNGSGVATLRTAALPRGTTTVMAAYAGNANQGASSASSVQTVN